VLKTITLILSLGHFFLGTGVVAVPTIIDTFSEFIAFVIATAISFVAWVKTEPLIATYGLQILVVFRMSEPYLVYIPMVLFMITSLIVFP
jgi:hypothetical protein